MDILPRSSGNSWAFHEALNDDLARITVLVLGLMAAFVYIWQLSHSFSAHLRRLASFSNDRQRYFLSPDSTLSKIKNHIVYAPLIRGRHNREFQLSRAVNFGTLPSRFHMFLIVGIVVMNVAVCVVTVPYGSDEHTVSGMVRNRTGTMATVNLMALVLMAGRNNPLITLLRVPFDTWNLLHRWLGRIVVLEAIAHTFAWAIPEANKASWDMVGMVFGMSNFMLCGLVAACAFTGLMVHSPSPIRHAFYETFLHLHIAMAAVAFGFLWIHLKGMPAQNYLLVAIVFWALEVCSLFRIHIDKILTIYPSELHVLPVSSTATAAANSPPQSSRPSPVTPCASPSTSPAHGPLNPVSTSTCTSPLSAGGPPTPSPSPGANPPKSSPTKRASP